MPGPVAMAVPKLLLWVLQSIFSNMLMVCDELDETTCDHMQQHSEMLTEEMALMLQELEQKIQEQRSKEQDRVTWRALLFAALWTWQFWVMADFVLLIIGLCWWLRKRGHKVGSSSKEEEDSEEKDAFEVTDLDMYVTMRNKWSVDKL
ncbi:uncharacterized protein ACIB01_008155 [Guaruba guarouba]